MIVPRGTWDKPRSILRDQDWSGAHDHYEKRLKTQSLIEIVWIQFKELTSTIKFRIQYKELKAGKAFTTWVYREKRGESNIKNWKRVDEQCELLIEYGTRIQYKELKVGPSGGHIDPPASVAALGIQYKELKGPGLRRVHWSPPWPLGNPI